MHFFCLIPTHQQLLFSFVRSFVRSFVHSFISSHLIYLSIHSFIHSFKSGPREGILLPAPGGQCTQGRCLPQVPHGRRVQRGCALSRGEGDHPGHTGPARIARVPLLPRAQLPLLAGLLPVLGVAHQEDRHRYSPPLPSAVRPTLGHSGKVK